MGQMNERALHFGMAPVHNHWAAVLRDERLQLAASPTGVLQTRIVRVA